MMSTLSPSSTAAAVAGSVPVSVRPSCVKVMKAISGIFSRTSLQAITAAFISCRSNIVSIARRSTPACTSASACSRKISYASWKGISPKGCTVVPQGPMSPATSTLSPPALRALATAASLIALSRPYASYSARRVRLAPKVLVSRMSAPAWAYSALHGDDLAGLLQIPEIGRVAGGQTAPLQECPHRAVQDHDALAQAFQDHSGRSHPMTAVTDLRGCRMKLSVTVTPMAPAPPAPAARAAPQIPVAVAGAVAHRAGVSAAQDLVLHEAPSTRSVM